jgi:hypothetical protein
MNIVSVKTKLPYDIYCGRVNKTYGLPQSKWANPFVIGVHGNRAEVIEKYRLMLLSNPKLMSEIHELKGKTLACWCNFPAEDCHCRILLELANKLK